MWNHLQVSNIKYITQEVGIDYSIKTSVVAPTETKAREIDEATLPPPTPTKEEKARKLSNSRKGKLN